MFIIKVFSTLYSAAWVMLVSFVSHLLFNICSKFWFHVVFGISLFLVSYRLASPYSFNGNFFLHWPDVSVPSQLTVLYSLYHWLYHQLFFYTIISDTIHHCVFGSCSSVSFNNQTSFSENYFLNYDIDWKHFLF